MVYHMQIAVLSVRNQKDEVIVAGEATAKFSSGQEIET
jgi:hypothetical protein